MSSITERLRARYETRSDGASQEREAEAGQSPYSSTCKYITRAGVLSGQNEISAEHANWYRAFPDLKHSLIEIVERPGGAAFVLCVTGTHLGPFTLPSGRHLPATRRAIEFYTSHFATIENDTITEDRIYSEFSSVLLQLGLSPVRNASGVDWVPAELRGR